MNDTSTLLKPPGVEGAPPAFEHGRIVGNRYEIKRQLGRGGMGEVWLAFDLRLRVEVALKVLLSHTESAMRLHQEIRAAREVISPNVCRVFDLVEADGLELLSMEFVDGITLRQHLEKSSPLEFFQAQEIAAQFLAGLEAIHAAGLVHRDFKPENVMMTRTGRVVVMDFGLAKPLTSEAASVAGTLPYMAPEQLLGRPVDRRTDIYAAAVVLAEMLDPGGVRDAETRRRVWDSARRNPPLVADAAWSRALVRALAHEPRERFESSAALARALEDVRRRLGLVEEKSPYPGLASFTEADAENFFGREAEVAQIWKTLSGPPRLLGVIGASGAGKSSLLRAGVIPARPTGWRVLVMTPGPRPFAALASILAPDLAGSVEAFSAIARLDEPDVAIELLSGWRRRHEGAVLIVDQFEELFTLAAAETQSRFAELASRMPIESDVHVVLSMRDDFLIRCHDHKALDPLFAELVPVRAPSGDALRRAIVQPALRHGYRFEDEALVGDIVAQVEGERAALPLAAFAVSELWERRDRKAGVLTRASYEAIGGVGGALAKHAEEALARIGDDGTPIVREILRNLVTAHGTRAVRAREEILSLFPDRQRAGEVLNTLIDERLLTSYDEAHVEIIHESLLKAWPRLVQWQTQDADGVVMRDHLRQASELWEERGRSQELLWSGNTYHEYEVWRARYAGPLSTREVAFADAMESSARRSGRRKKLAVVSAFAIAIAIAAIFGVLWKQSRAAAQRATAASRLAEAQKLLALAQVELGQQRHTGALAYARKSLEIADTPVGRMRVLEILWSGPIAHDLPSGTRTTTMYVKLSPDGKWLIVTSPFGPAMLFASDGGPPRTITSPPNTFGQTVKFTTDSRFVALQNRGDSVLHVYSVNEAKLVRDIPNERGGFAVADTVVTVTPTSSTEAVVRSWPLTGGPPAVIGGIAIPKSFIEARLNYGKANMLEVALEPHSIMPDGSIIYGDQNGVYRLTVGGARPELLWDVGEPVVRANAFEEGATLGAQTRNGVVLRLRDGTTRAVTSSALRVDSIVGPYDVRGTRAALVVRSAELPLRSAESPRARLWDLTLPAASATPLAEDRVSRDLSFDSAARWLAVSSPGRIQLYPLNQPVPRIINQLVGVSVSNNLMFTPDGRSIITCGIAGSFHRWRLAFPDEPPIEVPFGQCATEAVTPDGRFAVAGFSDLFLISLHDGAVRKLLDAKGEMLAGVAFDPTGEIVAASFKTGVLRTQTIRLVHLRSGDIVDLPIGTGATGDVPAKSMAFGADGTLYIAGDGGLRRCSVAGRTCTTLKQARLTTFAMSGNRRFLLARSFETGGAASTPSSERELVLFDLETGAQRAIPSAGGEFFLMTINNSGTIMATVDVGSGILTIGPTTGERRYLIPMGIGGSGLAISPDDKWVLTNSRSQIRLYPMPDLSKQPLQTLPHDELMSRLDEMTNLRAVPDPASATGYKLEPAPFHGWQRLPVWQ